MSFDPDAFLAKIETTEPPKFNPGEFIAKVEAASNPKNPEIRITDAVQNAPEGWSPLMGGALNDMRVWMDSNRNEALQGEDGKLYPVHDSFDRKTAKPAWKQDLNVVDRYATRAVERVGQAVLAGLENVRHYVNKAQGKSDASMSELVTERKEDAIAKGRERAEEIVKLTNTEGALGTAIDFSAPIAASFLGGPAAAPLVGSNIMGGTAAEEAKARGKDEQFSERSRLANTLVGFATAYLPFSKSIDGISGATKRRLVAGAVGGATELAGEGVVQAVEGELSMKRLALAGGLGSVFNAILPPHAQEKISGKTEAEAKQIIADEVDKISDDELVKLNQALEESTGPKTLDTTPQEGSTPPIDSDQSKADAIRYEQIDAETQQVANQLKEVAATKGMDSPEMKALEDKAFELATEREAIKNRNPESIGMPPGKIAAGDVPPAVEKIISNAEQIPVKPAEASGQGITHEELNAQLRSVGAEELDAGGFSSFRQGIEDAATKAKQDPMYGKTLLTELKASDRPPSNTEIFSLAVEKQRLTNELNAVQSERAKLAEIQNEAFREQRASELRAREEQIKNDIEETARAIGKNTSKAGAALGATRVLTNEDYSYAGITQRIMAATEGKALSPKARKVAQELSDEIKVNREQAKAVIVKRKAGMQDGYKAKFASNIYKKLEKAGMEAEKRIIERMGRARSGISPEEIADHVTHAAWLIAKGMKSVAEMIVHYKFKLGIDIRENAEEIWAKAKEVVYEADAQEYAKQLDKYIAKLEAQIKDRAPFTPDKKIKPISKEIDEKLKLIKQLKYERQNLRDELQSPKEYVPKEQRSLNARKEFRRKRIAELEKALDEGKTPAPKEKPTKLEDDELADLNAYYEMLKDRVEALADVEAYNAKGLAGKTVAQIGAAYDTTRNMSATGEFSVIMKQALPATLSSPIRTFKTYVDKMLRGTIAMSHDRLVVENKKMLATPEARQFMANGGFLSDIGGHSRNMDEQYIVNQFAQNTPGLKQAGAISQRIGEASAFFMNQVRIDMWKAGLIGADPSAYKNLARSINDLLGRSSLGRAEALAPVLNRAFFSARFWASTIKNITGMPLIQGKGVRPYIAKIYLRAFTTALTATAGLYAFMVAKHGEDNVEITPFGDVNVMLPSGNKKSYSLISSLAYSAKFGSKIVREGLEAAGIMDEPKSNGPFDKDAWQMGGEYVRTKLHPGAQLATTWLTGKDAVGNEVNRKELWKQAPFYPITYKDIYDAAREDDLPEGVVDFLALMHGAKVNTYEPRKKKIHPPSWK